MTANKLGVPSDQPGTTYKFYFKVDPKRTAELSVPRTHVGNPWRVQIQVHAENSKEARALAIQRFRILRNSNYSPEDETYE